MATSPLQAQSVGQQMAGGMSDSPTHGLIRSADSHHHHNHDHSTHSNHDGHHHHSHKISIDNQCSAHDHDSHSHLHTHHHRHDDNERGNHSRSHHDHGHHALPTPSPSNFLGSPSWNGNTPWVTPSQGTRKSNGEGWSTPAATIGGVSTPAPQPIPLSPFWQTSDSASLNLAPEFSPMTGLHGPVGPTDPLSTSLDLTPVQSRGHDLGASPGLGLSPLNPDSRGGSGARTGPEHVSVSVPVLPQAGPNLPHRGASPGNNLSQWDSAADKTPAPPLRSPIHALRYAPQERRKSWSGGHQGIHRATSDSHSVSFSSQLGRGKRRVLSAAGRIGPLLLEGTPSKLGRGALAGRMISFMNVVRFRGRDTKRLAILIALDIAYSTTEFLIGLFAGKIELVSDAFHLSFGCCILVLSLVAMVWGRRKADSHFTYGYGRLEVLAAFTNALFLLFLSFSLSVEALHAFMEDENEHKHYLIVSAVANLLVNLLGVLFFRHYTRVNMQYNRPQDMNHHAIFLHLLSDSIRSAGVILASWLLAIGVRSAETLCLGLVAVVVLCLTLPMLRASGGLLLQMAPAGISEDALQKCIREAALYEGVVECVDIRFWAMVPGAIVGTLTMRVHSEVDEQRLLQHVHSVFNDIGVTDLTVQIEQR